MNKKTLILGLAATLGGMAGALANAAVSPKLVPLLPAGASGIVSKALPFIMSVLGSSGGILLGQKFAK